MRLMVEAVRDYAIFFIDPTGRITSWNTGASRLKGYSAQEVIGQNFSIFYTEPDRLRGHPQEELRRAVADGRYEEEGWRVRKDGSQFWANVVITTIRDDRGEHIGFGKVTRDMTERKQAEERLRGLNAELEERIKVRTAKLEEANRELQAFSYSVSHDLRAPLRALDGFSRLLLDHASDKLSAQELDYLGRIRAAAQRMAQLTDAMLMLSRLTRTPMHPLPVDVSALCLEIGRELRQAEPMREVQLVVAPDLRATADPRLLRIVYQNLLGNAWKFTRKQAQPRIEVGSSATGASDDPVFFVRDNGVGFDPALVGKLFLPFQRLHRAKDFEGTGIGLATVRRIVERHGGRIWAEPQPGLGTTFSFTLPGREV